MSEEPDFPELHREAVLGVARYAEALITQPSTTIDNRLVLKFLIDALDGLERDRRNARAPKLALKKPKPKQLVARR